MALSHHEVLGVAQQLQDYQLISADQYAVIQANARDASFAAALQQAAYSSDPDRTRLLADLFGRYGRSAYGGHVEAFLPSIAAPESLPVSPALPTWGASAPAAAPSAPTWEAVQPGASEAPAETPKHEVVPYTPAPLQAASAPVAYTPPSPPPVLNTSPSFAAPAAFPGGRGERIVFTGSFAEYFITVLGLTLLSIVTFGLALPYFVYWQYKYFFTKLHVGNRRIVYTGSFGDYFLGCLGVIVLAVITFGLASPYIFYWNIKYFMSRMELIG